jgi:hypothetical protein
MAYQPIHNPSSAILYGVYWNLVIYKQLETSISRKKQREKTRETFNWLIQTRFIPASTADKGHCGKTGSGTEVRYLFIDLLNGDDHHRRRIAWFHLDKSCWRHCRYTHIDDAISIDDTISAAFEFIDAGCWYDIGGLHIWRYHHSRYRYIVSASAHFPFRII